MDFGLLPLFSDMVRMIKYVLWCVMSLQKTQLPSLASFLSNIILRIRYLMTLYCPRRAQMGLEINLLKIGLACVAISARPSTPFFSVGISPTLSCVIHSDQGLCFSRYFAQVELLSTFLESSLGWCHRTEPLLFQDWVVHREALFSQSFWTLIFESRRLRIWPGLKLLVFWTQY